MTNDLEALMKPVIPVWDKAESCGKALDEFQSLLYESEILQLATAWDKFLETWRHISVRVVIDGKKPKHTGAIN